MGWPGSGKGGMVAERLTNTAASAVAELHFRTLLTFTNPPKNFVHVLSHVRWQWTQPQTHSSQPQPFSKKEAAHYQGKQPAFSSFPPPLVAYCSMVDDNKKQQHIIMLVNHPIPTSSCLLTIPYLHHHAC